MVMSSYFTLLSVKVWVTEAYSSLSDLMDCSLPGVSVHRISQARIPEWVAISFSRGPSYPRIEPGSPALQADSLLPEPSGNPFNILKFSKKQYKKMTLG